MTTDKQRTRYVNNIQSKGGAQKKRHKSCLAFQEKNTEIPDSL